MIRVGRDIRGLRCRSAVQRTFAGLPIRSADRANAFGAEHSSKAAVHLLSRSWTKNRIDVCSMNVSMTYRSGPTRRPARANRSPKERLEFARGRCRTDTHPVERQ
jgi:hypothetical protein